MGFPGDLLELMGLNVLPALPVDHWYLGITLAKKKDGEYHTGWGPQSIAWTVAVDFSGLYMVDISRTSYWELFHGLETNVHISGGPRIL